MPIICLPLIVLEFVAICLLYRLGLLQPVLLSLMSLYSSDLWEVYVWNSLRKCQWSNWSHCCQLVSCSVFLVVTSISGSSVNIDCFVLRGAREESFRYIAGEESQESRPLHIWHSVSLGDSGDGELALVQRISATGLLSSHLCPQGGDHYLLICSFESGRF